MIGWQFPDATPVWSSFDAAGSPTSGSAFGTNSAAAAGARLYVLKQCVPITQAGLYVVSAAAYTPGGQAGGELLASYAVHLALDCSGGSPIQGGFFMPGTDQWQTFTSGSSIMIASPPYPQMSIEVSVGLDKTLANGNFSGYIDNVSLTYDRIFLNGFD